MKYEEPLDSDAKDALQHRASNRGMEHQTRRHRQVRETLQQFCMRTGETTLLQQWNTAKNVPLTPTDVGSGSNRMCWWQCEKGHEWQAAVKSRTAGYGCPICAHRMVKEGVNDLGTTHPELAVQWHPTQNGNLTPGQVMAGSHRTVWWICERGHEWRASIVSRAKNGAGCPVCAGKLVCAGENDLRSRFPQIACQWHPTQNGQLTPEQVTPYSNRAVWWICEKGHSYSATVAARTMHGSGCPYCAGRKVLPGFNDLATLAPEVAGQWHPVLNGSLTPEQVTAGSRKRIWWICPEGHVWKTAVYARTGGARSGCPVCAGKTRKNVRALYRAAWAKRPEADDRDCFS